ncbi:hypothetical protein [Brachybacterium sp. Marseille-Q7125]|uniref:hypothetical protein n=1 Tax=Brachybacterium sp. Marseille-Q7125 TaxID=2932815 RepID=UPI001FF6D1D7|nr:hypothetical protein [Brachybacterium sp. Marseille-Q7125]
MEPVPEVELTTFEGDDFRIDYPKSWVDLSTDSMFTKIGGILALADERPGDELEDVSPNALKIYKYTSTTAADASCAEQIKFTPMWWDEHEMPEKVDGAQLGGQEIAAYMVDGTLEGQPIHSIMYCRNIGPNMLQVVATTHGSAQLSPELQAILDSWQWIDG